MLYMLLVGSHPFDSNGSIAKVTQEIFNGEKIIAASIEKQKDSLSGEVINLVKRLCTNDPIKRPSAKEALTDPWFNLKLTPSNLEIAKINLNMRKVSKVYKNNERIGMSKLAVELLKFGIDSPTALKQKFKLKKCVSFEYDNQNKD